MILKKKVTALQITLRLTIWKKVSSFLHANPWRAEASLIYVLATSELQETEATDIWLDKPHSCKQDYKLNYLSVPI